MESLKMDKFTNPDGSKKVFYRDNRIHKADTAYMPSEGETLKAYCPRMKGAIDEIHYQRTTTHVNWHCHWGPNPCPICDLLAFAEYAHSILCDVVLNDKHGKWAFAPPKDGSHDPLSFTLKRSKNTSPVPDTV